MRRCPSCNSTFDDEYLSFCTNDGTVLVDDEVAAGLELKETVLLSEPPVTAVMPPPRPTDYAPSVRNSPSPPPPYGWANDSPAGWVPPPPPMAGIRRPSQQGLAVASLIFGLISITFGWICGGPVFGLVAVVLGAVALTQIKRNPQQYSGKPIALVGLITGGIALLVSLALLALWFIMMVIGAASG
ncbi:MAG TPA: DUF4190 domain-containing protein [Pyrinomonadaceae bacterium]|nr:DUF4190 domain-containing protein [Pyrinomonadaceae bacterium]